MNNKIDAIAFDLDGTLYNHNQYVTAGFKTVLKIIRNREEVEIYDGLIKSITTMKNTRKPSIS